MIGLIVSWSIVAAVFAMCIDWLKPLKNAITWLGNGTEAVLFVIIVMPANYLNGYSYKGKHHRDNSRQPTDSEVDRWRGADDKFADFLHTLNTEIHINSQASA